jgi:hypothetical protein
VDLQRTQSIGQILTGDNFQASLLTIRQTRDFQGMRLFRLASLEHLQNLGIGVIHGQKVVASVAVLGDDLAVPRLVVAIMATKATREIRVP